MTAPSAHDAVALPPSIRSHAALGLTAAAARGRFELQQCLDCGAVLYPAREMCRLCLSVRLRWREQIPGGELIADTSIHHSNDPFFRARLPWRVGTVRLDAGPVALVHVHQRCPPPPSRVRLGTRLDKSGQGVLWAFPIEEISNVNDDARVREMSADPRSRNILITDGNSSIGRALAAALLDAGARRLWLGYGTSDAATSGAATAHGVPAGAAMLPLDVTDAGSVRSAAEAVGAQIDLLINTCDLRASPAGGAQDPEPAARRDMEVNYFGLLHLAQEFSAPMRTRAKETPANGAAWINLLSIEALANRPPCDGYAASKAAALSLAQCLRTELRDAGVRVINVFPGPMEPADLANAVVRGLRDGVEDIYPGEIAQDWLARWREDPKILEREAGADSEVDSPMSNSRKIE